MTLTRRSLLSSGIVLLAGCSADTSSVETTPTERSRQAPTTSTAGRTPTATSAGPPTISFVGYAVQRSAYYSRQPDFEIVWGPPDRQLLFVMVTVEGGRPSDLTFENFSLRVNDRTIREADGVAGQDDVTYYPRPNKCVCEDQYETYATFPMQAPLTAEKAVVRWNGPDEIWRWELPTEALKALEAAPTTWDLVGFSAPDTVGPDESFTVSYQVENTGEATGVFRGILNLIGPMYGVSGRWKVMVDPGEILRREQTVSILHEIDSDVDEVEMALRTVGGGVDQTVQVRADTTER